LIISCLEQIAHIVVRYKLISVIATFCTRCATGAVADPIWAAFKVLSSRQARPHSAKVAAFDEQAVTAASFAKSSGFRSIWI
jgi:hypothetical protein